MANLTSALVFVLVLNVLMFLSQAAIMDMNPDGSVFYSLNGTILGEFDKGSNTLDSSAVNDYLPSGESSISPSTGNIFTDTFTSIKSWFAKQTGLIYIYQLIGAPYNMLAVLHLPQAFRFAVGTLWYAITIFLIIAFFWGRDA